MALWSSGNRAFKLLLTMKSRVTQVTTGNGWVIPGMGVNAAFRGDSSCAVPLFFAALLLTVLPGGWGQVATAGTYWRWECWLSWERYH